MVNELYELGCLDKGHVSSGLFSYNLGENCKGRPIMLDFYAYDAAVVVTPKDFMRVRCCKARIVRYLPVRKVLFVESEELGQMVRESGLGEKAGFVNENDLIPFDEVYQCMRKVMADILRGVSGQEDCGLVLQAVFENAVFRSVQRQILYVLG